MNESNFVLQTITGVMEKKHYTNSDLAGILKWSQSKLSKILSGQQKLSTDDLIMIAAALHVNPARFFDADISDMKAADEEIYPLHVIFKDIFCKREDADALIPLIEVLLPRTMQTILHAEQDGKVIEPLYRYKRIIKRKDGNYTPYAPNPHVLISDNGEDKTLGKRLTLGYWFTGDKSAVYLSVNYASQTFSVAGRVQQVSDEADMRRFFESILSQMDVDLDDMEQSVDDFDVRSAFRKSVIICKRYELDKIQEERELCDDLQKMYDVYRHMLKEANERMIDTYQNLWSSKLQDYKVNTDSNQFWSKVYEIDRILPVKTHVSSEKQKILSRKQAKERENYCCEIEPTHLTFTEKTTGKPYVKVRNLIPYIIQKNVYPNVNFDTITDNLVCLCPNCHAMLDHGEDEVREEMLMKLYMKHKDALKEAGVEVSMMQLLKWNGLS